MNTRILLGLGLACFWTACKTDPKPTPQSSAPVFQNTSAVISPQVLIPIQFGQSCAYIDSSARVVVDKSMGFCGDFSEGRAALVRDGKLGYINGLGQWIIKNELEFTPIYETRDSNGRTIELSQTRKALASREFHNNRVLIAKGDKFSFANAAGLEIISGPFLASYGFNQGYAPVRTQQGWTLIDTNGKEVLSKYFQDLGLPNENTLTYKDGLFWGWMSIDGKVLHKANMLWAYDASDGFVLSQDSLGFAFYSVTGAAVSEHFEEAYPFECDKALVKKNKQYSLLDPDFKMTTLPLIDAYPIGSCRIVGSDSTGKYGIFDLSGKALTGMIYDKGFVFKNGYGQTSKNQLIVVLDSTGKEIWNQK